MSKERLEEIKYCADNTDDNMFYIPSSDVYFLIKQAERVLELEREFELCDSTIHVIDMTINNPSTSDDDKFEKVNAIIKKYHADDCIHCNSKGFNGLDYCPNCIRGDVLNENLKLEQQNKCYRETLEKAEYELDDFERYGNKSATKAYITICEALEESE